MSKPVEIKPYKPISAHYKRLAPKAVIHTTPQVNSAPTATTSGCGDNQYARFIYMKESGCNPKAQNPGGCLGIGQACPGSKLTAVCPNLDYACENKFFTEYAVSRYGGWQQAYAAWQSQGWW